MWQLPEASIRLWLSLRPKSCCRERRRRRRRQAQKALCGGQDRVSCPSLPTPNTLSLHPSPGLCRSPRVHLRFRQSALFARRETVHTSETLMRLMIPIAVFALLSSVSVQAQAWDEHAYPDAGFAVQFPVEPQVAAGSYQTADGTTVPATVYSARQGSGVYTITVAELANTPADQPNAIADAVS